MKHEQRLSWISACIGLFGRFGPLEKKVLSSAFRISSATLSRDQKAFLDAANDDGLRIDGGKIVADRLGRPGTFSRDPDPGLDRVLEAFLDDRYARLTDIDHLDPPDHVAGSIMEGILGHHALHIEYLEEGESNSSWLAVSPHAVARVSGRFHARCFEHRSGKYRNFAMNRITLTTFDRSDRPGYVGPERDTDWHSHCDVCISLEPSNDTLAARLDHGLGPDGVRVARVREALLPLVLAGGGAGSRSFLVVKKLDGTWAPRHD